MSLDNPVPPLRRVFETADEMVIYKPSGVACERRVDIHHTSVVARLSAEEGKEVYLPHRLDAITCGLLLVARSRAAVVFHNRLVAARKWEKYYIARVHFPPSGVDERFLGVHKAFIKRNGRRAAVVKSGGKPSLLEILSIGEIADAPGERHLLIRLMTGRYHQIRVMCRALGLPLCGDPLYGETGAGRFYLEQAALGFVERASGQRRRIVTPKAALGDLVCDALVDDLVQNTAPAFNWSALPPGEGG